MKDTYINGKLVTEKALENDLSMQALSKQLKLSITTMRSIERREIISANTPIRTILKLAAILDIEVGDLFTGDDPDTDGPEAPSEQDADTRVLATVLTTSRHKLNTTALLQSLDWKIERLEAAISAMNHTLHNQGTMAINRNGGVYLTPIRHGDRSRSLQIIQQTNVIAAAFQPLRVTTYAVIYAVFTNSLPRTLKHGVRPELGRAINLDAIESTGKTRGNRFQLTTTALSAFPDLD